MIAVMSRRRAAPSLPVMATVVAVVFGVLIGLAVMAERGDRATDAGAERARLAGAVEAYADAVAPAAEDAGAAIILGIRPDVVEFRAGRLVPGVWKQDMEARARQFASARAAFAGAPRPSELDEAAGWFDRAFATYLEAVEVLRRAGDVAGAEREQLIDQGTSLGDRGDDLYDRGVAELQALRRDLGLQPDPRFPE